MMLSCGGFSLFNFFVHMLLMKIRILKWLNFTFLVGERGQAHVSLGNCLRRLHHIVLV